MTDTVSRDEFDAMVDIAEEQMAMREEYAKILRDVARRLGHGSGPGVFDGGGEIFDRAAVSFLRKWLDSTESEQR